MAEDGVLVVRVSRGRRLGAAATRVEVSCSLDDGKEQRTAACDVEEDGSVKWDETLRLRVTLRELERAVSKGSIVIALRERFELDESMTNDLVHGRLSIELAELFAEGKRVVSARTVSLDRAWRPLSGAGELEIEAGFHFPKATSRANFETTLARLLPEEAEEEEDEFVAPLSVPLSVPRLSLLKVSPRTRHLRRLERGAVKAEASMLLRPTRGVPEYTVSLRDRLRDSIAALRQRDTRPRAEVDLWVELRSVDSTEGALVFLDELLGLKRERVTGGSVSMILTDGSASVHGRRAVLRLVSAVCRNHPEAAAARLTAALRTLAMASQGALSLCEEVAATAGCVARHGFARTAVSHDEGFAQVGLVAPFALVLSRPRATSRRAAAQCFAACLKGTSGPTALVLTVEGGGSLGLALGRLRRCAESHGLSLPSSVTLLDSTVIVHCTDESSRSQLALAIAELSAELLPEEKWSVEPSSEHNNDDLMLALAPGAAGLANWLCDAAKKNSDCLEPFFEAACTLIHLERRAREMASSPRAGGDMASNAAQLFGEALEAAAPSLLRHAARCVDSDDNATTTTTWKDRRAALVLIEQLASVECGLQATTALRAPLTTAATRAAHDPVRAVRDAAKRALLALEALAGSEEPQSASQVFDSSQLAELLAKRSTPRKKKQQPSPPPQEEEEEEEDDETPAPSPVVEAPCPPLSLPEPSPRPWRRQPSVRRVRHDDDVEAREQVRALQVRVDDLNVRCEDLKTPLPPPSPILYPTPPTAPQLPPQKSVPHASPVEEHGMSWRKLKSVLKRRGLAEAIRRVLALEDPARLLKRLISSVSVGALSQLDPSTNAALVLRVAEVLVREHSPPNGLLVWLTHNAGNAAQVLNSGHSSLRGELKSTLNLLAAENSDRGVHAALLDYSLTSPVTGVTHQKLATPHYSHNSF